MNWIKLTAPANADITVTWHDSEKRCIGSKVIPAGTEETIMPIGWYYSIGLARASVETPGPAVVPGEIPG